MDGCKKNLLFYLKFFRHSSHIASISQYIVYRVEDVTEIHGYATLASQRGVGKFGKSKRSEIVRRTQICACRVEAQPASQIGLIMFRGTQSLPLAS